jgi:FkbM family methyltransferase
MKIKPSNPSEWNRVNGDLTYRINYNDLNQSSIVVDLGARHGNWSDLIKNKYNPKIYCFEIVNEFCNQLMDKGYNTFCMAVSDKKEKISIGIVDSEASIFNDNNDFEVDSIPASDIFKIINEDKIDLMKINVEGAEYPILKNLIETEEIKKIKNIQVQFHLFDGDMNNDYETISNELSKTHNITWRFPFVWENWELK